MDPASWERYLWDLLPRPYKVFDGGAAREPTEIKKWTEVLAGESARIQEAVISIRDNWLIRTMSPELLDEKGFERGRMTRWAGETDEEYRMRLESAFDWYALGGTTPGIKTVLQNLGYRDVKVIERVSPEKWAEFAVEVTLPPSSVLNKETVERITRIINEIKAGHTVLASLGLVFDPPDIGLPPDHFCRYDYCHYSHGYWPRPVEHWGRTQGAEPVVLGARYCEEIRRIFYYLVPTYGVTRYDELFNARQLFFATREFFGYTHITDRIKVCWKRRWLDGGPWTGKWGDEHCSWESVKNAVKIQTFPFALGVYSWSEPLGSLNCCYAPRYRYMESPGAYGTAKYGDLVGPTEYRPIYRFRTRVTPIFGEYAAIPRSIRALRVACHYGRTTHPGHRSTGWTEREHPGRTFRFDGKRTWWGGWSGKWNDVDETFCRTRKISVEREHSGRTVSDHKVAWRVDRELLGRTVHPGCNVATRIEREHLGRTVHPGHEVTGRVDREYLGRTTHTGCTVATCIEREHSGRTVHPGQSTAGWAECGHSGRTFRFDGERKWSGRWNGKWNDVNEAVCRTRRISISIVREDE